MIAPVTAGTPSCAFSHPSEGSALQTWNLVLRLISFNVVRCPHPNKLCAVSPPQYDMYPNKVCALSPPQ